MDESKRSFLRLALGVMAGQVSAISSKFALNYQDQEYLNDAENLVYQELLTYLESEARYIISTQNPDSGAFNNVFPGDGWTWISPRENAIAIIALLRLYNSTQNEEYHAPAIKAVNYLASIQAEDGSWFNQYANSEPSDDLGKSPTHAAEIIIALGHLEFSESLLPMMAKAADYLLQCQDVVNKGGIDDGLICGGKDSNGNFVTDRWTQDNAFAYQALRTATDWCKQSTDSNYQGVANDYQHAAERILSGINEYLFDPELGIWHRNISLDGTPNNQQFEWGNYAPAMLGVPAEFDPQLVAKWIHDTFQTDSGGLIQNTGDGSHKVSPGFTLQAIIAWQLLGQTEYIPQALEWLLNSGLHENEGGWVDWVIPESGERADDWEKFIDTSGYFILAMLKVGLIR